MLHIFAQVFRPEEMLQPAALREMATVADATDASIELGKKIEMRSFADSAIITDIRELANESGVRKSGHRFFAKTPRLQRNRAAF